MTIAAPPLPETPAVRLMRLNWHQQVHRDATGVPRLPPEFVAEQGPVSYTHLDVYKRQRLLCPTMCRRQ